MTAAKQKAKEQTEVASNEDAAIKIEFDFDDKTNTATAKRVNESMQILSGLTPAQMKAYTDARDRFIDELALASTELAVKQYKLDKKRVDTLTVKAPNILGNDSVHLKFGFNKTTRNPTTGEESVQKIQALKPAYEVKGKALGSAYKNKVKAWLSEV